MKWYKMYVKSMHDIKFKKLKKMSRHPFAYYWTAWCTVLDYCSEHGGVVKFSDNDDIEILFEMIDDLSFSEISDILEDFESVDLITYGDGEIVVKNWEKYQVSDLSTGRVQKHREIKKNAAEITEIMLEFNKITGKNFSIKTESNREHINARLENGNTKAQMIAVVQDRVKKWGNDPKMKAYIRPSTIFLPANFDKYLNEIPTDYLEASVSGKLIKVRDLYGTTKHVTEEQFNKAAEGFYNKID